MSFKQVMSVFHRLQESEYRMFKRDEKNQYRFMWKMKFRQNEMR